MLYEINQMIDYLDEFFSGSHHATLVGGIAGTQIERYVLDAATKTTPFTKVLVLNGCQDYIGIMKERLPNVLYYADILVEEIIDGLNIIDPWKPRITQDYVESAWRFDTRKISAYDIIVVLNSQLVPRAFSRELSNVFSGKIIHVTDPLEYGECYGFDEMPVIVDHLEKVSPMIALARSVFGFDSRSIDRKVAGSLTETNRINKRSIGKIDDCQYVTNDWDLLSDIREKQLNAPFRKNQKVIVNGGYRQDYISISSINTDERVSLTPSTMLVISNPSTRPLMQMRIYNSKIVCGVDVSYGNGKPIALYKKGVVEVHPANIITMNEAMKHRFNKVTLILGRPLEKPTKYSILKNSTNVTVVNNIKDKTPCLDLG